MNFAQFMAVIRSVQKHFKLKETLPTLRIAV